MKINNRRYTGSKYKLMPWIKSLIIENCTERNKLFDVFGGTGIVTAELLDITEEATINDFLYSNEVIYKAFFGQDQYDQELLDQRVIDYSLIEKDVLEENYVSVNYGERYFNKLDAKLIGYIREDLQVSFQKGLINEREFHILLTSLLYSLDRCANTVGHYEAFRKNAKAVPKFKFELIEPLNTNKIVNIYREDANKLARKLDCDLAFVDPPYNSRQYSRFYHVLETITKWDKPELCGVAMKPPEENMSEYCRVNAPAVFSDLIENLNSKFIVVTYNNTYDSKSSSSRNKISLEEIEDALSTRGRVKKFDIRYSRFNAGKTEAAGHKEYVFITEVSK